MDRNAVVIIHPPMDGETNMAIDDSLLANATPDWPIVLRIYRWAPATVSLGRFQESVELEKAGLKSLPYVRRKTGGGAILHDHEITYSVLIPSYDIHKNKGHSDLLYRSVHQSFANRLRDRGWDARLSEECSCPKINNSSTEPFLCFLRRTPVDLLVGTHKILGSAQRRSNAGLLQHGSFLIRHSFWTPQLLGLVDIPKSYSFDSSATDRNYSYRFSSGSPQNAASFGSALQEADFQKDDLNLWVDFVVRCVQAGLEDVVNCNWQVTPSRRVLNAIEPIAGEFA